MKKKLSQDYKSFWDSEESVERYSKMKHELNSIESMYLCNATQFLKKDVSEIKILDLGCGGGRTTIPIYKMGYKVIGVDNSKILLNELSKKQNRIPTVLGNAEKLPFKNKSFDIVIFSHNSIDCLYPYESRERCLKEIKRVLVDGGFYIFSSHIFNLLPYNKHVLGNILRNLRRLPALIRSGYYVEKMGNGDLVELFSNSPRNLISKMTDLKFVLISYSRLVDLSNNYVVNFIRSLFTWEVYYIFKNNK